MISAYKGTPATMDRLLRALSEPVFLQSVVQKHVLARRLLAKDTIIANLDDPDKGVIVLDEARPGHNANVTFVFWDRRLNDKFPLALDGLVSAAQLFDLRRITAYLPGRNPVMDKFLRTLDFRQEGVLRRFVDSDRDCFVYGITRSAINARLASYSAQMGATVERRAEDVFQEKEQELVHVGAETVETPGGRDVIENFNGASAGSETPASESG